MRPLCFLTVLLLGGCMGIAHPEKGAATQPLSSFMSCNFRHPDGSALACSDRATRATVYPGRPTLPWVCIDAARDDRQGIEMRTYSNPITGDSAAYYHADVSIPVAGLVHPADDSATLIAWHAGPQDGYVLLPGFKAGDVDISLYWSRLSNSSAPFAMEEIWSIYQNQPYPLVHLTLNGSSYYVESVFTFVYQGSVSFMPLSTHVQGADFAFDYEVGTATPGKLFLDKTPTNGCSQTNGAHPGRTDPAPMAAHPSH